MPGRKQLKSEVGAEDAAAPSAGVAENKEKHEAVAAEPAAAQAKAESTDVGASGDATEGDKDAVASDGNENGANLSEAAKEPPATPAETTASSPGQGTIADTTTNNSSTRKRVRSDSRSPSSDAASRAKHARTSGSSPSAHQSVAPAADATTAATSPTAELEASQEVASSFCGTLIGRGGSVITQMRNQSGARITISPGGQTASTRTICYTGTAASIAKAQALVAQQLQSNNAPPQALGTPSTPVPAGTAKRTNNPMSTHTETIACPMTHVGGLIGKGGSVINQLRSQSGCRITIRDQRPGTMHRDVVVSGTRQQVAIGQALVVARMQSISQEVGSMQQQQQQQQQQMYSYSQQMVAQGYTGMQQQQQQQYGGGHMARAPYGVPQHPGSASSSTQVTIPNTMVGKLIGHGGETINRLKQQSGCEIQIAPEGAPVAGVPEGNRVVTLRGNPQAIVLAQQLMRGVLLGQ